MKNLFKILFILILVLTGCSDDHNVIIDVVDEGVQLKWIGCNNCCGESSTNECLWYTGWEPPQEPYNFTGWDYFSECSEITLFQSEGYFNFTLSENLNYIGSQNLSDHEWVWELE